MNPTIGGGTAFNDIVAQLLATLGETTGQRAQVGAGLFSDLLSAQTAARRRPVNIVDQLLLANEFGSTMPLSQIPGGRLASQFGVRENPALGNLFDIVSGFAQGALPQARAIFVERDAAGNIKSAYFRLPNGDLERVPIPPGAQGIRTIQGRSGPFNINFDDVNNFGAAAEQSFQERLAMATTPEQRQQLIDQRNAALQLQAEQFNRDFLEQRRPDLAPPAAGPTTGVQGDIDRSGAVDSRDAALILQQEAGLLDENFNPIGAAQMQSGGNFKVDPLRATTAGQSIAGPATVVDRLGKPAAVIGEGRTAENVAVTAKQPLPAKQPPPTNFPTVAAGDMTKAEQIAALSRGGQFRLAELQRRFPGMNFQDLLGPAGSPGKFNEQLGITDSEQLARAQASQLLGGAIESDIRFQNPLVRALALGRAPTSAELNAREFAALPPDLRDALIGVIGEDQLPGFLFALGAGTPVGRGGVRQATVGGVRI